MSTHIAIAMNMLCITVRHIASNTLYVTIYKYQSVVYYGYATYYCNSKVLDQVKM